MTDDRLALISLLVFAGLIAGLVLAAVAGWATWAMPVAMILGLDLAHACRGLLALEDRQ